MSHDAWALVAAATALRVFAGDVRGGLRRLLSLGVRVGSAQLLRERPPREGFGRNRTESMERWWEEDR